MWKTWKALQQDYWWPTIKAFVKKYVMGCATCQQNKTITHRNQPPLQPITIVAPTLVNLTTALL